MEKKREEREMVMFFDGVIEAMPVFAKELVAGGVAGGFAKTVVAPLERIKILFQLGEGDYVMPRKNYPLWNLISGNPLLIKAKVHEWSTGEELERILLYLSDTITIQDNISILQHSV